MVNRNIYLIETNSPMYSLSWYDGGLAPKRKRKCVTQNLGLEFLQKLTQMKLIINTKLATDAMKIL